MAAKKSVKYPFGHILKTKRGRNMCELSFNSILDPMDRLETTKVTQIVCRYAKIQIAAIKLVKCTCWEYLKNNNRYKHLNKLSFNTDLDIVAIKSLRHTFMCIPELD